MRAWHAGPLVNSTAVEALTSLLIFMNIKYKSHSAGLRISGLNQAPEPRQLIVTALPGIPEVVPGDDLVSLILAGVARTGGQLQENDVLVLAQKVVSKAEGRYVRLADVEPSLKAQELATHVNKDARLIELILQESNEVIRTREDVIIVEHKLGFILANAGIDASNIGIGEEDEFVLLLPKDPDANATAIRRGLERATGLRLAVVINDSLGRAWRQGTVGTAIGVSGLQALLDLRGRVDRRGRELKSSQLGLADEVAASASLMMGQASEGSPIVLMRGVPEMEGEGKSSDLIRTKNMDLFR
jgi:coenzyme F420-0:L-glutamate ligase/coenzyme F420-1:gamma-L-glutamate ligase